MTEKSNIGMGMTPEELAELRAEIREIVADFRLMDDDFMSIVFNDDTELVGFVLSIILGRDDLKVVSAKTQVEYKSVTGRSIRLDVKAIDENNKVYNIEVQRSDKGAGFKRARFYSSMIDSRMLEKSQDFDEIADTYVIFITERDKFGRGLPIYHIERTVRELGNEPFGDGAHIIYVNGEYRNADDPIGKLMHDFHCRKGGDMFYPPIAERVDYFKVTEGGNVQMCRSVEALMKKVENKTEHRKSIETAQVLISIGKNSFEEIAKASGLTVDEIKELARHRSA